MSPTYLEALVSSVPIWLVITPLVGIVNGALFFLIVGRRPSSLFAYVALATVAASLVQALGIFEAGSPPFSLGDVQLVAVSIGAWLALTIARGMGL